MGTCSCFQILVSKSLLQSRDSSLILILVLSPASITFLLLGNFLSDFGMLSVSLLSAVFWCRPKNGHFLAAVFLATDFGKKG